MSVSTFRVINIAWTLELESKVRRETSPHKILGKYKWEN